MLRLRAPWKAALPRELAASHGAAVGATADREGQSRSCLIFFFKFFYFFKNDNTRLRSPQSIGMKCFCFYDGPEDGVVAVITASIQPHCFIALKVVDPR